MVLALARQEVEPRQLIDPVADVRELVLGKQAVGAELVVAVLEELGGLGSLEDLGHVARAEALLDPDDAREDLLGHHQRVRQDRVLAEADVAGPAVLALELLAEVAHQEAVPAGERPAEAVHLVDLVEGEAVVVGPGLALDGAPGHGVGGTVQEHALGVEAIAARAARLLLVVLDGLGHARVDDKAHIGAIDPHPEGDGRHDEIHPLGREGLLVLPPGLGAEARMVRQGLVAQALQGLAQALHVGAADAVDHSRLARMAIEHRAHLPEQVLAVLGAVEEVRPIEVAHQGQGVVHAEGAHHVLAHRLGGGGGVGVDPHLGEPLAELGEVAVVGPELVAPLADAVRLVHGEEADGRALEQIVDVRGRKALGREVQELDLPVADRLVSAALLVDREGAVEGGSGDAVGKQRVHLVLHEGQKGRDDHRHAVEGKRRQLVAHGLTAAGGQDDEAIPPLKHGLDGLGLVRQEAVVAPVATQQFKEPGFDPFFDLHESI
ncbi:hypothetical protein D3C86_1181620 [compost metagenome]